MSDNPVSQRAREAAAAIWPILGIYPLRIRELTHDK